MALKGNLRDFSILQLLHLVNLAKKTGTLVVEGTREEARVTFRDGKLAYTTIGVDDNSLAAVLQRANRLTIAQYKLIKERAGHMSDQELGLLLINAGYTTQAEILNSLQQYFIDSLKQLFTWVEGFFLFNPDELLPDGRIAVKVDLENIIIEASRQMREWAQLQEEIPSLDMALKFTDRPGTNIKNINLSVEEWRVVSYVNPKNTMKQISKATKMNDLEIRRVVFSLLQAGLVEMIRPAGMPIQPSARMFPTPNKVEQTGLINKLINRIRSL
jgi:hypothetical protein